MKYWIVGLYIQYKEGKIWGQEFVMIDRSVNGNAGGQFKKKSAQVSIYFVLSSRSKHKSSCQVDLF